MTVRFSGCGIAGILRLGLGGGDDAGRVAAVTRMSDALAHRGPHGAGLWHEPGVALGHRRLAVTDLSDAGNQPMTRDHLTIVYNGEAYNAPELRSRLSRRFPFTTHTDTEVVLRAWQQWGTAALDRLEGMYAFAIWDDRLQALTLVRDRIGIKPLYYRLDPDALTFASEIEALLKSGTVARRPDVDTLTRHLLCSSTLQIDRCRTPVDGVLALPPATWMTVHRNGRQQRRTYWSLPGRDPLSGRVPHRQRVHELRGLLDHSVTAMMMGDVPVGAFLSGGIDSTSITAMAARRHPVTAVTAAYGTGTTASVDGNDDLRYSRLAAAHLGDRIHHHVIVQPHAVGLADIDAVCDLAAIGDDPRHPTILRNYQAVRDVGLRVVLNGQGADEIMGGYVARPGFIAHLLDVRHPNLGTADALPASRQIAGLSPWVLAHRDDAHDAIRAFHRALPGTPAERAHRLLFHTQLARVVQFEDFLGMRNSVEARFPYLNHRLVEWAFQQPFENHIHAPSRRGKVLLTDATRPLLPAAIIERPKAVFPHPNAGTLHAALAALVTEHTAELRRDPLVTALLTIPDKPSHAPVDQLWSLLSLWRWHHRLQTTPATAAA